MHGSSRAAASGRLERIPPMFDSVTINALSSGLDGLAARQRAIADNVANINTPNYRARVVSFENALASSVASGSGSVAATESRSTDATNVNGNNVNLDRETLSNIETLLRYQFASRAVGADFDATRAALKSA
jgi:flagellar basal-body rod protein FlgB